MKRMFYLLAIAVLTIIGTGCNIEEQIKQMETGDKMAYEPKFVISIHEIVLYPRGELLEREIDTFSGDTVWINTNQLLHSRNIKKIRIMERHNEPGFYDLWLTLDRRGFLQWSSFSYRVRGRKLMCVIDGLGYRRFVPPKANTDEENNSEVRLPGPFDEATAKGIEKYVEKNYEHYNPKF